MSLCRTQLTKGRFPFALLYLGMVAIIQVLTVATLATAQQTSDGPKEHRSQHILMLTDLPADEAKAMLSEIEQMLELVAGYYDRKPVGLIQIYAARDLKGWPAKTLGAMEEGGKSRILAGLGRTTSVTARIGGKSSTQATIYAPADRRTLLHESVHGYCRQTFHGVGPVWYAEGMAEMGQYWKKGDPGVNAPDEVIGFLKKHSPKSSKEVVESNQLTGDSRQAYATRWALCHLLANNPNYSAKFRPLGISLMLKQPVSFDKTYGPVMAQLDFEYRLFLADACPGYRVDLCAWDWKTKFAPLKVDTTVTKRVEARRGWQATGATLTAGTEYLFETDGNWTIEPGKAIEAKDEGGSKMMGALLVDGRLGAEFAIRHQAKFTPGETGDLYVRCDDAWGAIADNEGVVALTVRPTR
ncbi:hypothetical protein ETAA8_42020 [Anatilimnocola aggregata]|uniref:DUF1570 domain-containing protein n=1 Tax=Anatilimnocola aggregata TaxID=2528021 RepID=A0A517YFS2_9BACT|nr:hypothetical protein [Anatilimnocola aggregata]QDU29095.1 hypothetical protein ETAA8_42020 [Anatilimnocola aggregata]